jgi:hypothetical protein
MLTDGGYTATSGFLPFPAEVYDFLEDNIPEGRGVPIN